METWARRRLAHEAGVAAGFTFLTLDAALDAAVAAVAPALPGDKPPRPWWIAATEDIFTPAVLAGRISEFWAAAWGEPWLEKVRTYLAPEGQGAAQLGTWRGVALAQQVAERLVTACRERPERIVAWATDPVDAPLPDEKVEPWFAHTAAGLELHAGGPAAGRVRMLASNGPALVGPPMVLLGVDGTRDADRRLLQAIARHTTVRWYRPAALPARWKGTPQSPLPSHLAAHHAVEETEREALSGMAKIEVRGSTPPRAKGELLAVWQAALRGETSPVKLEAGPALQLQGHWTPSREVEALRDVLLSRFNDRSLEPRDVVVMTPDLATYAPLIQAIFARRGSEARVATDKTDKTDRTARTARTPKAPTAPAIPVSITQLGLSSINPLADAVLRLVDLCTDRLTVPALLDVLTIAPVQRAMGLAPEDIADVTEQLIESGARWGVDGKDRLAVYGVEVAQNTVTFGLQRMALGVVMPDEAPEAELGYGDEEGAREPLAPMATGDRERLRRTARLSAIVQRIVKLRDDLQRVDRTATEWKDAIQGMVAAFTHTGDTTRWLVSSLSETLDEALPAATTPLSLDAVRRLLRARFDLPVTSRGNNNSAVTVVPFTPGAILPCGFLALLGMNTGEFPRVARPLSWEPSSLKDAGRRLAPSAEALDRQAFAQAILGTTDDVFISFVAREPRRGESQSPCVPVDELVEFAERAGADAKTLATQGTRHPWSTSRPGPWFDAGILAAANVTPSIEASRSDTLPAEANRPIELEVDKLAADLTNGAKLLLYGRLGIYLAEDPPPATDREPLGLSHLDSRAISNALLATLIERGALGGAELDDDEKKALVQAQICKFAATGTLPLRAGGASLVAKLLEEANDAIQTARDKALKGSSVLAERPAFTLDLPVGLRVFGRPEAVMQVEGSERHGHLSVSTSRINSRRILRAWTRLLAAAAMPNGANVSATALLGGGELEWHMRPPEPAVELNRLAELWFLGRRRALPLFPKCSLALAKVTFKHAGGDNSMPLRAKALAAVRGAWETKPWVVGDDQDPYIQRVFPGWQPEDALEGFDQVLSGALPESGPLSFRAVAEAAWRPVWMQRRSAVQGQKEFTQEGGK